MKLAVVHARSSVRWNILSFLSRMTVNVLSLVFLRTDSRYLSLFFSGRFESTRDFLYWGEGGRCSLVISGDFLYEQNVSWLSLDSREIARLWYRCCTVEQTLSLVNVSFAHHLLVLSSLGALSVTELYLLSRTKCLQVVLGSWSQHSHQKRRRSNAFRGSTAVCVW